MKITFLGTGTSQGVPVIGCDDPVCLSEDPKDKRMRSSVLIQFEDLEITIDCGPDFRQQMLNAQVSDLDAILFTHIHADHTAGLDDVRPFSLKNGPLAIYAQEDVLENLQARFGYIFATENRYAGAPSLEIHPINLEPFYLKDHEIIPIEVLHGNLKILGYRIKDLAYLTDVKTLVNSEKDKLKNLEVLVISALRIDPHPTHLNLEEALKLVEELKPQKAYFTHISHKLGFHESVSKALPENVFLAFDGLQLSL